MKKINYLLLVFTAFLVSCTGNTDTEEKSEQSEIFEKQETVCIWDGVPVREAPAKDGKWLTSINLGETLYFLGETVIDSLDGDKEYIKVELSDGKVAWARSYGLIINGKVAAIKENTNVYDRPDLLTVSKKKNNKFKVMDVLAIEEVKEDWIKVIGKEKKVKGWIKNEAITENEEDVAVAILASKQLFENGKIVVEKIEEFIENLPYKSSVFNEYLKSQILENGASQEEVVETTEEDVE